MKHVNKDPLFPKLIGGGLSNVGQLAATLQNLMERLYTYFNEYAFRLNRVYPKDGSENADFLAITSSVSAPATDATRAVIYVDTSDGDLKVKFKNGDVQVIATVSV